MSLIAKEIERHSVNKALDSREGEGFIHSIWMNGESFINSLEIWMLIIGGLIIVVSFIAWNLAGKGQGSHAGREEVRRSYRRALAREMAKQDAEKIRRGEKQRRKWMQW